MKIRARLRASILCPVCGGTPTHWIEFCEIPECNEELNIECYGCKKCGVYAIQLWDRPTAKQWIKEIELFKKSKEKKQIRLIDADAVAQEVRENNRENFTRQDWTSKDVCTLLENAPTVDAVEVVRCKDCKYYDNSEGIQWCSLNSKFAQGGADWHSFPEYGFCSYGERRDDK